MEHIKYAETQTHYVVHPTWATSMKKTSPSFLFSNKMKRQNLQQIYCNILYSLSQSPYLFLTLIIHIQYTATIQYPHTSKVLPSREKNPKLNITSTIRSSA